MNNTELPAYDKSTPLQLRIFLILFLVVEFSLLTHFPVPYVDIVSNTLFLVVLMGFSLFYIYRSFQNKKLLRLLVLLLPLAMIPLLSALRAQQVFGQPLHYGILAERTKFLTLTPLLLIYLIETGKADMKTIGRLLISIALVYFSVAFILNLLVDPEFFRGTKFVIFSMRRGPRYNLGQSLIVLLLIYALYKMVLDKNYKYYPLIAAIFTYLIVFAQGRSLLAALVIALACSFFFKLTASQRRVMFMTCFLTVLAIFTVCFIVDKEWTYSLLNLFLSGLAVFQGGEVLNDPSANSRILQAKIALEGLRNQPWFGTGMLSVRWNDGFQGLLGHFYPSDIGWLGILYLYGIIGFIILTLPFASSWAAARKIPSSRKDTFYHSIETFMVFIFFHSIIAGFTVKKIGIIVLPFAIIYIYRHYIIDNDSKAKEEYI